MKDFLVNLEHFLDNLTTATVYVFHVLEDEYFDWQENFYLWDKCGLFFVSLYEHFLVQWVCVGAAISVLTHFADPDALSNIIPNTSAAIQTIATTNTPVPTSNTVLAILLRELGFSIVYSTDTADNQRRG